MKFISIPENYASLEGGLVYDIDLEGLRDTVEVSIINSGTEEVAATLRFAQTALISLDIAPYVRRMFDPQPAAGLSGCIADAGRVAEVTVAVDGVRSPSRRYTPMLFDRLPRLLTTLPGRRTLAAGECDEVAFYAPAGGHIHLDIERPAGIERTTIDLPAEDKISLFILSADSLPDDAVAADLIFESGGRTESISYDRAVRPAGAVRLAWVAASGAIESYTFPSHRRTLTVTRDAFCSRTGHRTVSRGNETRRLLLSDYEPQALIEALEEILSARRVWCMEGGCATETEVLTAETLRRFDGPLNTLTLEIRNISAKEGCLC